MGGGRVMDSTQRISERGRPQNLNQSYYVRKSQDVAQTVQVSDDQSVQGEHKSKVAGVASDRRASLGKFILLFYAEARVYGGRQIVLRKGFEFFSERNDR